MSPPWEGRGGQGGAREVKPHPCPTPTPTHVPHAHITSPLACRPILEDVEISEAAKALWEAPFAVLSHDTYVVARSLPALSGEWGRFLRWHGVALWCAGPRRLCLRLGCAGRVPCEWQVLALLRLPWPLSLRRPLCLLCRSEDPKFVYANATALALFEATWDELIGTPSTRSAEAKDEVGPSLGGGHEGESAGGGAFF